VFLLVPQTNIIIEICPILLFTLHNSKNIAHHIMEELIFYADKIMVMDNSKNLNVFNFVILLKLQKFDAREIYMFYSMHNVCSCKHTRTTNIKKFFLCSVH